MSTKYIIFKDAFDHRTYLVRSGRHIWIKIMPVNRDWIASHERWYGHVIDHRDVVNI